MLISLTKHVLSSIKAYFWCTTHAHNFPCTLVHCEEEGSSFWTEGLVLLHRSIQSLQKKPIELFTMIDKQVLQLNISCWHRYQHEGVIDVEGKPKNIVPGENPAVHAAIHFYGNQTGIAAVRSKWIVHCATWTPKEQ